MDELIRTMVVCGLVSGTQPFTIMGLLLVLGGHHGRRNVWFYVLGGFTVQTVIVLVLGILVGGTVDESSTPGRSLVALRIVAGLALLGLGVYLRRPATKVAPDTPKVFDRLTDLRPFGVFVAGIAIADYQGAMLATTAIATSTVSSQDQVLAWLVYTTIGTGLPAATVVVVGRSGRAKGELERVIAWIMANRRMLSSWICLVAGLALTADGLVTFLTVD